MMHASNDNPVLDNPRLAELTSWDAPWSGLRAVVAGIGVSGFAAADTLIELGALVTVLDSRDTERNRQSAKKFSMRSLHSLNCRKAPRVKAFCALIKRCSMNGGRKLKMFGLDKR